jgi:segregation and condensation protein B
MSELANLVMSILFYESDSLKISDLEVLTKQNQNDLKNALDEVASFYNTPNSSLVLLNHDNNYQLVLSGQARDLITECDIKEREGELSRPALETLCCIIYLGSATKSQIDYIRGVQSSYMIRVLVSRGLIARSAKVGRDNIYIPTVETLRFLGLNNITDMPDYEKIHNDLSVSLQNIAQIEE